MNDNDLLNHYADVKALEAITRTEVLQCRLL
jgi:hypothetical protein